MERGPSRLAALSPAPGTAIDQPGGLQRQVVGVGERRSEGTVDLEMQGLGGGKVQVVAQLGEADQAVEQVVAVRPPPDDVEIEIDLGPRPKAERGGGGGLCRRAQPPLPFAPSPCCNLASMGATRSASGLKASARCHWKRASFLRPSFQ